MSWYKKLLPQNIIGYLTDKIKSSIHGGAERLEAPLKKEEKEAINHIMSSGQAPQEWLEETSRYIIENGYPPEYGFNWAVRLLESGKAPEEWRQIISKRLVEEGKVHSWAERWVDSVVQSGKAPPEWMKEITRQLKTQSVPEIWANGYVLRVVDKAMESGKLPPEWMDIVEGFISGDRYDVRTGNTMEMPHWCSRWFEKICDERSIPPGWVQKAMPIFVDHYVSSMSQPKWMQNIFWGDFDEKSSLLMDMVSNGSLDMETVIPNDSVSKLMKYIERHGYVDGVLDEWLWHHVSNKGSHYQSIMNALTHNLLENNKLRIAEIPGTWKKWNDFLISRKAPPLWYNHFHLYIIERGVPLEGTDRWAESVIRSGGAPAAWGEAMALAHKSGNRIAKYASVTAWAEGEMNKGAAHFRKTFSVSDRLPLYAIRLRYLRRSLDKGTKEKNER